MRITAAALLIFVGACGNDEPLSRPSASAAFPVPREAMDLDPSPEVLHAELTAAPHVHDVAGQQVAGFAYNGQTPGPTLRARVGDRLIVDLSNELAEATTIHWHGAHVPYAMDGVTWQKQPILARGAFRYEFTLTHSGTFWYHPHFDSTGQVDGGLYGVLVVEDPSEPKLDDELVLVFDQWHERAADSPTVHGHGMLPGVDDTDRMDGADPAASNGRQSTLRSPWTVNGHLNPRWETPGGRAVRVRLLNASNSGYLDLRWPTIRQIAGDQGLLPRPIETERIVLAPGDRAEVEWLIGEQGFTVSSAPFSVFGSGIGALAPLMDVVVIDPQPSPEEPTWSFIETNPTPDPGSTDVVYTFTGDVHTDDWRINGEKFPDVTIASLPLGTEAVIEVRNSSPTEHPFHLHGHAFEVLSVNGAAPPLRRIEDTWNLGIRDIARLRVVADNSGEWMAHCHILPHADGGMMTVLRVLAP